MNIGNVKIKGKAFLSPMAGTSNSAYMKICEEMDVGYAVTELISSEAITRGNKKTFDMLNGYDKLNIPVAVQLFGSNSKVMGEAARIIDDMKLFDVIDINMGCPVTKIAVSSSSGSALLKDPEKVGNIVSSVVSSVKVPVTVKIRSGWDHKSINACEIARICEENGASAITIHGRTRSDGYGGKVDLDIIKKVKESVSIPVIGNGDIKNGKDAENMMNYTKCDAIMVGRAALGNPWVFKNINNYFSGIDEYIPTLNDRVDMIKRHLDYLLEIKPERTAILEMRTNASYYLKGISGTKDIKEKIFKCKTKNEFIKVIESVI
ncbi:MAG: tRNA dihydrouridine synthase DusB [Bacilli bacterium]|nr:tRNA dihydrouridine synthase DusB [Bacilli bacterium]